MALANVPHLKFSKEELAFLALHDERTEPALVVAICWAESEGWSNSYRPESQNRLGGQDNGLMQINDKAWGPLLESMGNPNLFDPIVNMRVARIIRRLPGNGWGHWNYGPNAWGPKQTPPRAARTDSSIDIASAQRAVSNPVNPYWRMHDAGLDVHDLPRPAVGQYTSRIPAAPLKFGDSGANDAALGQRINTLQLLLLEQGLFTGSTDRYFGTRTRDGVRNLQQRLTDCGLWTGPLDGIFSVELRKVWDGARRFAYIEGGR